jgi:hypothetical protein
VLIAEGPPMRRRKRAFIAGSIAGRTAGGKGYRSSAGPNFADDWMS